MPSTPRSDGVSPPVFGLRVAASQYPTGIFDPPVNENELSSYVARMQAQPGGPKTPEQKFIEKLKARKIADLEKYEKESGMIPCKRDYVFDLKLMDCVDKEGKDVVTRKFRCSGDMNLRTWTEKLLLPICGYMRG
jgi:hypothetical protein